MKKAIILISILSVIPFISAQGQLPPPGSAGNQDVPTSFFGCGENDTLTQCIARVASQILKTLTVLALVFAAIMFAWAGIQYIAGGSDDKKRETYKNKIIYSAVGLVISFLAWSLAYLLSRFAIKGTL